MNFLLQREMLFGYCLALFPLILKSINVIDKNWFILSFLSFIIGVTIGYLTKSEKRDIALNKEYSFTELKENLDSLIKNSRISHVESKMLISQIKETLTGILDVFESTNTGSEFKSEIKRIIFDYLTSAINDYKTIPTKESEKRQIALSVYKDNLTKIKQMCDEINEKVTIRSIDQLQATNNFLNEKTKKSELM